MSVNKLVHALSKKHGNIKCADCTSMPTTWTSINLGIFLCVNCAGVHRSMGTHISQVRSINLDQWTSAMLSHFSALGGNDASNAIYEAKLNSHLKINPFVQDRERSEFIFAKYRDRRWYEAPTNSQQERIVPASNLTSESVNTITVSSQGVSTSANGSGAGLIVDILGIGTTTSSPPAQSFDLFGGMSTPVLVVSPTQGVSTQSVGTPSAAAAAAAWAAAQVSRASAVNNMSSTQLDLFEGMTPIETSGTPSNLAKELGSPTNTHINEAQSGLTSISILDSSHFGSGSSFFASTTPTSNANELSPRSQRRLLRRGQMETNQSNSFNPTASSTPTSANAVDVLSQLTPKSEITSSFSIDQLLTETSNNVAVAFPSKEIDVSSKVTIDDPLAEFPGLALEPGEVDELGIGPPLVKDILDPSSGGLGDDDESASGFDFLNDNDDHKGNESAPKNGAILSGIEEDVFAQYVDPIIESKPVTAQIPSTAVMTTMSTWNVESQSTSTLQNDLSGAASPSFNMQASEPIQLANTTLQPKHIPSQHPINSHEWQLEQRRLQLEQELQQIRLQQEQLRVRPDGLPTPSFIESPQEDSSKKSIANFEFTF